MGESGSRKSNGPSSKRAHPSERARRRRLAAEKLARSARVLVCECEPKARPAVGDVVRGLGFEVTAHHSLADALREATTETFDAIVASVPGADEERMKLLGLLKRTAPKTPLVIVTSDGSLEMRKRCQSARPYYFAVRPIDPAELRTVLTGAVARAGSRD